MFITDENRGQTVSDGHGIIAQKRISEIVTLHKKLMYYNKNIRGTCNSIHFRYNVLDLSLIHIWTMILPESGHCWQRIMQSTQRSFRDF